MSPRLFIIILHGLRNLSRENSTPLRLCITASAERGDPEKSQHSMHKMYTRDSFPNFYFCESREGKFASFFFPLVGCHLWEGSEGDKEGLKGIELTFCFYFGIQTKCVHLFIGVIVGGAIPPFLILKMSNALLYASLNHAQLSVI